MVKLFIIYKDLESSRRAYEFCESLQHKLGPSVNIDLLLWHYNLLENAAMRELAIADAVVADQVIVCGDEGSELPPGVRSCMAGWLLDKSEQTSTLVAILDGSSPLSRCATPVRDYLLKVAEVGKVQFVCHETEMEESEALGCSEARVTASAY
jgi:hypothetical protein